MSATNATPTISLPLFIGTDKPAWLTDWNGAMNTIDSAIATLQTAEAGTATSLATLAQSVEALSGTVSQHTTSITTISTAVAGNTGSINTINSLIGNGQPTTEDKTIIGAINEIYAEIGSGAGVAAADVTYDNTTSGLTADDVQEAIDEVNAKISTPEADDISYDNTTSGLTASNVQAAIDELAQGGAGGFTLVGSQTGTTPITLPSGTSEVIAYVKGAAISGWDTGMSAHLLTAQGKFNVIAGYYLDSSSTGGAEIRFDPDTNTVFIHSCYIGGSDVTSNAVVTVYAK